MDLRDEDRQFLFGKALLGFANVLRFIAVAVLFGGITIAVCAAPRQPALIVLATLAGAGLLWASALVLVSQARVEKNTREAAKTPYIKSPFRGD
jgi:uncharacterized membrane protein